MSVLATPWLLIAGPWRYASNVASLATSVLLLSLCPGTWRRTVRNVFARQILFTGIEATAFVAAIGLLVGISVVAQAQVWLGRVGQKGLLGEVLVLVIIREAAPLLTNFVVIGRSGTAIATELATMRINGEVDVLDSQGIEPIIYLALPRVIGVMFSVFALTVFFILVSFASGYMTGLALAAETAPPARFVNDVLAALNARAFINLVAKTFIPGLATGAICCLEGISVRRAVTEIPQAGTRALTRSVIALFLTSALVSVLTFL